VRGSCSATSEVYVPMDTLLIDSAWTNDVGGNSFETRARFVFGDGLRGKRGRTMLVRGDFG